MTPETDELIRDGYDVKAARQELGWSLSTMAEFLRLSGGGDQAAKVVREMENGARNVTGPVSVAIEAALDGFRPEGFSE